MLFTTLLTLGVSKPKPIQADGKDEFVIDYNNYLVEYNGKGGKVVIPENLVIVGIGKNSFFNNDSII